MVGGLKMILFQKFFLVLFYIIKLQYKPPGPRGKLTKSQIKAFKSPPYFGGVGELPFSKKYFCHEGRFDPLLDPLLYALAGESDLEASACRGESKTSFCPETIAHCPQDLLDLIWSLPWQNIFFYASLDVIVVFDALITNYNVEAVHWSVFFAPTFPKREQENMMMTMMMTVMMVLIR